MPAELAGTSTTWTFRGDAIFRWSVFDVYRVSLYTCEPGLRRPTASALVFEYLRNLDAETLVVTTMQEIERIVRPDPATLDRWQAALRAVVPPVVRDARLTVACDPKCGADFHFNGEPLGTIGDGSFAAAFLAVWLDPATRAPEVRSRLLSGCGAGDRARRT